MQYLLFENIANPQLLRIFLCNKVVMKTSMNYFKYIRNIDVDNFMFNTLPNFDIYGYVDVDKDFIKNFIKNKLN